MSGSEEKLIIGKQVYLSALREVRPATIHIKGGKIIGIYSLEEGKKLTKIPTTEIPDECVVLPGIVDSHVHVNEPGRTHWEGFATATRAAAAGGVTTLADMPLNSIPPTTTIANFEEKLKAAHKKCWMDTCFIGGAVHDNASHLKPLLNSGIRGFKCFLIHSGVDEFTHVSEEQARLALKQLQGTASFLMFHAEVELPSHLHNSNSDPKEYKTFLESRPKEMENKAIEMVIKLCKETNVKCHIVHLSSSEALPLIRQAKSEGVPISVETCFHYLYFDAENIPKAQPKFKCCPPIREKDNRDKLWEGLREGLIDLVVSDHSPCTPELKKKGGGDYLDSWGGISSLQFGLSILFTEATRRGFTYSDMMRWMAEKPAALLGLADRKGYIDIGYDADLIVFNPTKQFVVKPDTFYFKNKMSAYEDQKLTGTVQATFLRGTPIYYQGKFPNMAPQGNLLLGTAGDITPQSNIPLKKLVSKL